MVLMLSSKCGLRADLGIALLCPEEHESFETALFFSLKKNYFHQESDHIWTHDSDSEYLVGNEADG